MRPLKATVAAFAGLSAALLPDTEARPLEGGRTRLTVMFAMPRIDGDPFCAGGLGQASALRPGDS